MFSLYIINIINNKINENLYEFAIFLLKIISIYKIL